MKAFPIAGAFALALMLAACGDAATSPDQQGTAGPDAKAQNGQPAYEGQGHVTSIAGDQVSISHGPIAALGWPAMTMAFRAGSARMVEGIGAGDRVAFQFREGDGGYVLTSISRQ